MIFNYESHIILYVSRYSVVAVLLGATWGWNRNSHSAYHSKNKKEIFHDF